MPALLAAALLVCGCQSLTVLALKSFDPKPYAMPVAAGQLVVTAIQTPEAAPGPGVTVAADAASASLAENLPEADQPPSDIRGRGDGLMVNDRIVVTAERKVPHRVPNFSREQVAAIVCTRQVEGPADRLKAAQRAYAMTLAATEAREGYLAGRRSGKEFDAAERGRQDAVESMMSNGMLFGLFGARSKKADLPKPELDGLVLENVDLYTFIENGAPVMAVSGSVRNSTSKSAEIAPVTLAAIDEWGFILAGQTSLLPFERLAAGETRPFEIRFFNAPDTTYEIYAHFVPPFEYRIRRECDPTDPAGVKSTPAPRSAATTIASLGAIHTAAELNLLTNVYRSEAESAWNLRACGTPGDDPADDPQRPRDAFQVGPGGGGERRSLSFSINLGKFNRDGLCAAWLRRLPWRESFALGESADTAWASKIAVEEKKRQFSGGLVTQADVDVVEDTFRRDYERFRSLGAMVLARAGGSVQGVEVNITSSSFGYDQLSQAFDGADISRVGFYVDVAGAIVNTTATPRRIDALMLALVDRLEQPLLTFRLDDAITLGAGEAHTFQHRVYFADPIRRKNAKDAPPWQVRVGAVAQPQSSAASSALH